MSHPRSFFLRYLHFCASRMGKALSQETQARLSTQAPLLPPTLSFLYVVPLLKELYLL